MSSKSSSSASSTSSDSSAAAASPGELRPPVQDTASLQLAELGLGDVSETEEEESTSVMDSFINSPPTVVTEAARPEPNQRPLSLAYLDSSGNLDSSSAVDTAGRSSPKAQMTHCSEPEGTVTALLVELEELHAPASNEAAADIAKEIGSPQVQGTELFTKKQEIDEKLVIERVEQPMVTKFRADDQQIRVVEHRGAMTMDAEVSGHASVAPDSSCAERGDQQIVVVEQESAAAVDAEPVAKAEESVSVVLDASLAETNLEENSSSDSCTDLESQQAALWLDLSSLDPETAFSSHHLPASSTDGSAVPREVLAQHTWNLCREHEGLLQIAQEQAALARLTLSGDLRSAHKRVRRLRKQLPFDAMHSGASAPRVNTEAEAAVAICAKKVKELENRIWMMLRQQRGGTPVADAPSESYEHECVEPTAGQDSW
eukprot:TRINITY_DN107872_c0_g1_i1.p1 TRINITY_DN107872_c0_g1~~TRINITY_DN107872_c0_g1_i1.p1  ORF type:complete len:446 (-),score=115.74 TRINITY_DN107872_c0_g1_i1:151-1440(-)